MKKWNELPLDMQVEEVKKYYKILEKHKGGLVAKRIFDVVVAAILLKKVLLSPVLLILSVLIKWIKGPAIARQVRVTTYGKKFRICKFRTMVQNAEKIGTQVTTRRYACNKNGKAVKEDADWMSCRSCLIFLQVI